MVDDEGAVGIGLLVSPVRRRIVDLLAAHAKAATEEDGPDSAQPSGLTAADLAAELELHVTTVRFHLDQLVAAGLLASTSQRGLKAGRPRKLYAINPGSLAHQDTADPRVARAYEVLAGLLARVWSTSDGTPRSPEDAGREWSLARVPADARIEEPAATAGQWLDRVGRTIDLLAEWGYTAEVATSQGGRQASIKLYDCPLIDLARERPDVVCGVHRGLLAGAMLAFGEGSPDVSLQPFTGPRECLAHVTRPPFAPPAVERQP